MPKKRAHGEGSIFRRKDGLWQGAVTIGCTPAGKQNRKTVYGRTQSGVRAKLETLRNNMGLGVLPEKDMTTGIYLDRWLREKEQTVKPRTVDAYAYIIAAYIKPAVGRVELERLKPLQVQAMVTGVSKRVSADAANKARRVLFGALKQAVRWQLIVRNPVEAVEPLKVEPRAMTLWTAEEAARFLAAAQGDRCYALFYLAMSTGLRRGELLGLHWSDLDSTRLRVRRTFSVSDGKLLLGTPKTRKGERSVALTPDTVAVLDEHRRRMSAERNELGKLWRRSEVMFPSEIGDYYDPNNLSRHWRSLLAKAAVRKIRLHDLRHLHASIAIRSGMDPKVLANRLGHARASFTLDVYTHLFEEQIEASAVSIQTLLTEVRKTDHQIS